MSSHKDAIQRIFREHLKIFVGVVLAVLIALIAAGGIFVYLYRSGPEYACKNLCAALSEGDTASLAAMVDFRALSEDLVRAVSAVYPQTAANEEQKAEMRDEAQRLALKALAVKKDAKPEAVLPHKLFEPVPFVPEDVIAQFAAGMQLEKAADGGVQIRSHFMHNELQTDFPVILRLERRQGDWLVTRLLYAEDLVRLYKEATDTVRAEDEAKLAEKNEKILAKMHAHFDSPQCMAAANMMGDRREAMLVIKVTAKNTDAATLHSVNLLCDVHASDGTSVFSRRLEAVRRVYGGGEFSNTWTVGLDADSEETARLLQAGPLSCTVEPKVMSVGVGEILYQRKD